MNKYIILAHTMKEADPKCHACNGSGSMYASEDTYIDCMECTYDTEELDEQYVSEAEVDIAIKKLQMLDKLAGIEKEYEWEIL